MFRKIIRAFLSFLSPKKRKKSVEATPEVRRIALCIEELNVYKRRNPEVRSVKAGSFSDAYCFFLRMCDRRQMTYRRCGGYSIVSAALPGNAGIVELTDRCGGFDKRVVAEMKIDVPALSPNVSKIKFVSTNNR